MKIALFPNERKPFSVEIAKDVGQFLKKKGIQIIAEDPFISVLQAQPLSMTPFDTIDFRISLGGDGTMLRLIHRHPDLHAPLLGINLGSLGFLADIPLDDILPSLEGLLGNEYTVQKRMMIDARTSTNETCFAANEIVLHRANNPSLIDLAIYTDGSYVNTFSADGVILSTPTGSTAYSLAAGGPIISPELDAFLITPICPHTISNRPIVLKPNHQIEITYESSYLPLEISFDGISNFSLPSKEKLIVTIAERRFHLVNLHRHNYFHTLREKLGWQGRLKT
jgi:NAD+ kinase